MSNTVSCACRFDPYTGEVVDECPRHKTVRTDIEYYRSALRHIRYASTLHAAVGMAEAALREEFPKTTGN